MNSVISVDILGDVETMCKTIIHGLEARLLVRRLLVLSLSSVVFLLDQTLCKTIHECKFYLLTLFIPPVILCTCSYDIT